MKWVVLWYSAESGLAPCYCHPKFYKKRIAYVLEKHGVTPEKIERVVEAHCDFGGAICTDDPCTVLPVGKDRTWSCWTHHTPYLVPVLKKALERIGSRPQDGDYAVVQSHWGHLFFLSKNDCNKLLKALGKVDPAIAAAHEAAMQHLFDEAHARVQGLPEEKGN